MRLKWGDPFVFDSGGKEALFLHEQGIPFEVVPGIPPAIGAPGVCGHSGHLSRRGRRADVRPRARGRDRRAARRRLGAARRLDGTLVCYAGARQIGAIAQALLVARPPGRRERRRSSTTARCRRSRPSQGTLGDIADAGARDGDGRRCWSSARSPGCASTCAGSTTGRSSASASSSRDRASRRASSSSMLEERGAEAIRGADHPHRAARRLPTRSTRACDEAGHVRLDRLHQRATASTYFMRAPARHRRRPRAEGRAHLARSARPRPSASRATASAST